MQEIDMISDIARGMIVNFHNYSIGLKQNLLDNLVGQVNKLKSKVTNEVDYIAGDLEAKLQRLLSYYGDSCTAQATKALEYQVNWPTEWKGPGQG